MEPSVNTRSGVNVCLSSFTLGCQHDHVVWLSTGNVDPAPAASRPIRLPTPPEDGPGPPKMLLA